MGFGWPSKRRGLYLGGGGGAYKRNKKKLRNEPQQC